jgi:glutamate-1-semialdehyde 2,1-aminomutase
MSKMAKYGLIIQARYNSTRLPGKVLKKIGKHTVLNILIKRLSKLNKNFKIIVATGTNKNDDKISDYLKKKKISIFRGSNKNVLSRFFDCAKKNKFKNIIRITADCPLIDCKILEKTIELFENKKLDYASNTMPPTFPDGLDVEVFTFSALRKAYKYAKNTHDLEHVTPYIRKNKFFKKDNLVNSSNYSNLRWTLDEPSDLKFLNELDKKIDLIRADYRAILKCLKKYPYISKINRDIIRNEGAKIGQGQKLWKRAKEIIPGGNMLLSKRSEMFLPNLWPSYFKSSKYNQVIDLDGNKFTDFIFSVGQNILGYRNQNVEKKVIRSLKFGNMTTLNCYEEVKVAEKLIELHPWFDMVRFARSGGEANAIAVRIARASTNKPNIAICGYHGWHDWYLASNLTGSNKLEDHLLPGLNPAGVHPNLKNTVFPFEYNNFEKLKKIIETKKIGIIKMEVSRNYGPKNQFLEKIRKICDEKKIILIFDECTSGFRECFGGLHKHYNIKPDIAMFGKALGNGHAITAVVGKKEIMSNAQKTFISSTFWTERVGNVAALATMDEMERIKSWKVISKIGKKIKKGWNKLAKSNGIEIDIGGLDALCFFSIKSKNSNKYKTLITQEMLKKKFLASNIVYVSIAHDQISLNNYFERLDDIFKIIKKCEDESLLIDNLLKSEEAHTTFKRLN